MTDLETLARKLAEHDYSGGDAVGAKGGEGGKGPDLAPSEMMLLVQNRAEVMKMVERIKGEG